MGDISQKYRILGGLSMYAVRRSEDRHRVVPAAGAPHVRGASGAKFNSTQSCRRSLTLTREPAGVT